MPLYNVTIGFPVLVYTGNEKKAQSIALRNALEEVENIHDNDELRVVSSINIQNLNEIPPKWKSCMPWKDEYDKDYNSELTCSQLVEPFTAIVCGKCKSHSKIYTCVHCSEALCTTCTAQHLCKGE